MCFFNKSKKSEDTIALSIMPLEELTVEWFREELKKEREKKWIDQMKLQMKLRPDRKKTKKSRNQVKSCRKKRVLKREHKMK